MEGVKREQILWCQIHNWYPIFKKFCLRTEFLKLEQKEIDYLRSNETIILPEPVPDPVQPQPDIFGQIDSDECWSSDWSEDDEPEEKFENPIPELCKKVEKILVQMKHRTVPKLNWSSPSDALHMSDNTLKCSRVNQIFLLLKSSDKVNHDLTYAFENCNDCEETDVKDVQYTLALQTFARLQPASEFRCFVRNKKLVAFCQRDTGCHDGMAERVEQIRESLIDFVTYDIVLKCPLDSFVVDIYIKRDGKFWIFGFNPFSKPTFAVFFNWEELYREDFGSERVEFRYNDGNSLIPLPDDNRVPLDALHISKGLDGAKLADYCELVRNGKLDGESLQ